MQMINFSELEEFNRKKTKKKRKKKNPLGTVPKFNRKSGHINTSNTPFIFSGFTSMKMARINKRYRKPKGQSRMDNPGSLATLGTYNTGWKQTKYKTRKTKMMTHPCAREGWYSKQSKAINEKQKYNNLRSARTVKQSMKNKNKTISKQF